MWSLPHPARKFGYLRFPWDTSQQPLSGQLGPAQVRSLHKQNKGLGFGRRHCWWIRPLPGPICPHYHLLSPSRFYLPYHCTCLSGSSRNPSGKVGVHVGSTLQLLCSFQHWWNVFCQRGCPAGNIGIFKSLRLQPKHMYVEVNALNTVVLHSNIHT